MMKSQTTNMMIAQMMLKNFCKNVVMKLPRNMMKENILEVAESRNQFEFEKNAKTLSAEYPKNAEPEIQFEFARNVRTLSEECLIAEELGIQFEFARNVRHLFKECLMTAE